MEYTLNINGEPVIVDVDPDMPLLWVLRDELNLLGTKFGCGIGQCGSCSVHLNGSVTRSCLLPISAVAGTNITTIEGLANKGNLHPLQKAWVEHDVAQCGYCQSGQIMQALALLKNNPDPNDNDINLAMNANLCRCGTYDRIRKTIKRAASIMRASN